MGKPHRSQYAVYDGEEIIAMGTSKEISERLNISQKYIVWMTSPAYQRLCEQSPNKKRIAIRLED